VLAAERSGATERDQDGRDACEQQQAEPGQAFALTMAARESPDTRSQPRDRKPRREIGGEAGDAGAEKVQRIQRQRRDVDR
jgi:hypothetical protein